MALLDEGETDWKVLVVDIQDPLASKLNDIEDVERHLPGLVRATNEWFRWATLFFFLVLNALLRLDLYWMCRIYKIPDGKPENQFAFSGEAKNKKYATEIIHECHEAWRRLMSGESPSKTASYDLSMYVPGPSVCKFSMFPDHSNFDVYSRNITIPNSVGFTSKNDPAYTGIPPDSRKPPAPIDSSSKLRPIHLSAEYTLT